MNFTLLQALNVLRARYKVVLCMLLVTLAVGVAVFLLVPKQYTSASGLVFDVRAPDPVSGAATPVANASYYVSGQVDVINSTRVARKVIAQLRLTESPAAKQQWLEATDGQGNFEIWLAGAIRKYLKVTATRESNVVLVGYTSEDPNFAAAAANAFAQAYIEANIELKTDPARQFARWFDEQSKVARTNLEKTQARLSEFLQKHGIVTKEENLDAETAALAALTTQLTEVRSKTFDSQSKQRADDTLPDVMQSSVASGLRSDIAQKEAKLQEAANNLGTNHPQYRRMEAEIAELKKQLKEEMARVSKGFSSSTSAGRGREAELRAAIEAQRKKLLDLKNLRDQLAVLQRDVDAAQSAYSSVGKRYDQSNLEAQLTQTNVFVLSPAETPIKPSFPDPLKFSAVTVLLGIGLGCGLAFLLELLNRRVRSVEDVTTMLELPVLVTIERLPRRSKPGRLLWWRRTALTSR
jgi:protein tyrosine kinase modulator